MERAFAMPLVATIDVDQLEPGDLKIDRTTIPFPEVTLRRTRASLGIKAAGAVAERTTLIVLTGKGTANARWSGEAFGEGNVASSGSRVDVLTRGPATFYAMAVDRAVLPHEFVKLDLPRVSRLRSYIECLVGIADRDGYTAALQRSAGRTLLNFLTRWRDDESGSREPVPRRLLAVRRCEEYVFEHIDENPTLADLTSVSGLQMRSLINAFRAVTGYSPMAYLKTQRLNAVRRALCVADGARTRIIDVAANWGFWHMGHFTADYRAMFGETPSQTLRK